MLRNPASRFVSLALAASLAALILAQTPSDLMIKGEAAYRKKEYAKSAEFYLEAYKKDSKQTLSLYNAACILALGGKKDEAIDAMQQLAENGFNNIYMVNNDTDFATLTTRSEK